MMEMSRGGHCCTSVRAVLTTVLMLGGTLACHAGATLFGVDFPNEIAGATFKSTTDYEKTDPGLGYGVRYRLANWAADSFIFIYDAKVSAIPDDSASAKLKDQFRQAQGDMSDLERNGTYTQFKVLRNHAVKDRRGRDRLLCTDYAFVQKNVGEVDSFLCVGGSHGKFVKFLLTTKRHPGSDKEAAQFVGAWLPILWP
jgi:hypothetical protein